MADASHTAKSEFSARSAAILLKSEAAVQQSGRSLWSVIVVTVVPIAIAVIGLVFLEIHARTPGADSLNAAQWPASSRLPRTTSQPMLVTFFHPYCPCSRSSLLELQKLVALEHATITAIAVLVIPPGCSSDWSDSELIRSIEGTSGLIVVRDLDAVEAQLFGVQTSGHTLLYDRDGTLQFSGGLTAARGHEGPGAGCPMIKQLILDPVSARIQPQPCVTKVFGCPLIHQSALTGVERLLQ